ncbi:MAG: extracellular solute-binding protein [Chloroflexi bacterium]|nr:extracellular solute-binding protein [Chloroflexota bacterium]
MKGFVIPGILIGTFFVLMGCARPATIPEPSAPKGTDRVSMQPWQEEWERILAGARKEGKAVVYTGMGPEERAALTPAFKDKFGIDLEFVVGRGTEQVVKLATQRRAGLYLADVYIGGGTTHQDSLKPDGMLEPLNNMLLLPEVLEPRAWYGGQGPIFVDRDKYILGTILSVEAYVNINTDMVKPGEIKYYRDLLGPKWKGQVVMGDPTRPGRTATFTQAIGWMLTELGKDYLGKLARQEPVIIADDRLQVEWVARGKYPVVLAPRAQDLATFMQAKAPLQALEMGEGGVLSGLGGFMAVFNHQPNPNAARLFINWFLTKEAQTLLSKSVLAQSARDDVPTDFLDAVTVRKPGVKYYRMETEEAFQQRFEVYEFARQVFGPLMKK